MADSTFIKRVKLKNYRSIASCDVKLGPLNFLVGPNGSGKSNFLDALRFVGDSLKTTFVDAIQRRGGLWALQWHKTSPPPRPHIAIELEFAVPSFGEGSYSIVISSHLGNTENLRVRLEGGKEAFFEVQEGTVKAWSISTPPPPAAPDVPYLRHVAGYAEFGAIHSAMLRTEVYNINQEHLRQPTATLPLPILQRDGLNFTDMLSHLERLEAKGGGTRGLILEYLRLVTPSVRDVMTNSALTTRGLVFVNTGGENDAGCLLDAISMSDGTLRALGNLVALFQLDRQTNHRLSLVGIEEPETGLHPGAAGVLLDALREASQATQVIVTTHSPDLLDNDEIPEDQILAVDMAAGATHIDRIDEASRSVLAEKLSTPGELLKLSYFQPGDVEAKSE